MKAEVDPIKQATIDWLLSDRSNSNNMTSFKVVDTVHVITSVQRRRHWNVFEKKAIVEETAQVFHM